MSHKQVLIIDDNHAVRATVQLSLEVTTDWKIFTAGSGREGLYLAQSKLPDLILLDIMMPDIDGFEVLRQLRNKTTTQAIPIVFLTAKNLIKEEEKYKDLKIQGVISKPFDAVDLEKQIHFLLNW